MYTCAVRPEIASLSAYVPGMSIAEVRERYGLSRVIKMASNENPPVSHTGQDLRGGDASLPPFP